MRWPFQVAVILLPALAGAQEGRRAAPSTFMGADYTYTDFEGAIEPWSLTSLSIMHRRPQGTFIARANLARRFGTTGEQFEFEGYPRFNQSVYAYLSSAFSPSKLFPRNRHGAELFRILPRAWEVSAGVRTMHFQFSDETVLLYTGSIGRYYRNDWYSLRPYLRSKNGKPEISGTFNARRYGADIDSYYGVRVGYGSTTSEQGLTSQEIDRVSSATAGAVVSKTLSAIVGMASLDFSREEPTANTKRNRWELLVGIRRRF